MVMPKISIIMPVYNCEKYIRQATESVLAQTYSNWELIIIDDCSTDETQSIAETFQKQDYRIHIFHNSHNCGVGAARNLGVEKATGQWIAFLDGDDAWDAQKLEKQVCFLAVHPKAKLIFTSSAFMRADGRREKYIFHVPKTANRRQLLKQNVISCSSVLVCKEDLLNFPFQANSMLHEDYVTWLWILAKEPCAYGLDEPLLLYRLSSNSKSGNKLKAAKMQWNSYGAVGLNLVEKLYYMLWYAGKSLLKYKNF